ncbi:hypothetical protein GGR51DRAFT_564846 [Nemania sp. FL0031]|nr:hypothetical protein GGR51DRAFT_564846 [Nemania sp. FL0031]
METPLPTRRPTPQNEGEGTGNVKQTMELVPKRTPLPTWRPIAPKIDTLENKNGEADKVVTKSTPRSTNWLAIVLNDSDETKDSEAKSVVVKKRTPLPTLLTRRPVVLGNNMNKVNRAEVAVAQMMPRPTKVTKRPRLASKCDKGDKVDPNTVPALKKANGVVLESGKYRCNICGNQMQNNAHTICSHNSNFHPKDPRKVSAYMRRNAFNPHPCRECGKICNSLEAMRQHIAQVHGKAN